MGLIKNNNISRLRNNQHGFSVGIVLLLVVILGMVGFVGYRTYSNSKSKSETKATSKIKVKIAWLHQAQFAGIYVAQEKGFYKDAGLEVELSEYEEGNDVNTEVSSGKVDYSISNPLEIALSRDKGYNVKAIAAIYQTSPYVIVTRKDANIVTPADLKGKTLGIIGGNNQGKVTYAALLANAGVKASEVTSKDIGFDIVQEFKDKTADTGDVYRTDQTFLLDQEKIGYNVIYPEQYGFAIYGDCLIASDSRIKDNPEQVQAFVSATLKGWEYAIAHSEEALQATAKYENELYKDAAYEKHILETSIPLIKPTGNQKVGHMQFIPWNKAYQGVKASGLVKTDIKVGDLFTTEYID